MPAYNFKSQFATSVESGRKRQTIRSRRRRPTVPGDKLYLYTGMRTSTCRKLAECVCINVQRVCICSTSVSVDGHKLDATQTAEFARADGFDSSEKFFDFFREHYGFPYLGEVIQW